ncbi:MAG: glucose-6-phosphate dehydrogenase [Pelolinea sp.]|nr:glucose-6-phosphate dehydrogenase [Pelolinea sp.]
MDGRNETTGSIAFVIFGVTGDLTKRKLLPALYQLAREKRIPERIDIIGFARRPWDDGLMQQVLTEGIHEYARISPVDNKIISELLSDAKYILSEFEDRKGYDELNRHLDDKKYRKVIFYLATPPDSYANIINNISACQDYAINKEWLRIVVEKPYGRDLNSAQSLENDLRKCFSEEQIFRIDHYLGKETVQNILVFRFANGIFEPLWNKNFIDHVQITVSESTDVGTRAGYFDTSGVIRDMFANHLLQLVTLTAMEAPYAFNAESVRDEKMKVLKSLRPLISKVALENTIRGQYDDTKIAEKVLPGYLHEDRVAKNSITETYLSAKLFIDNWRWANVPFYIRSGKCLPVRATEIAIQFKQIPLSLFNWKNMAGEAPNVLVLRLQPDEGITLSFGAKLPGPVNQIAPVNMEFCYQDAFGSEPPEAYERLLLDCILGDQTLFTRHDEVIEQWRFVTEILKAWEENPVKELPKYQIGSWGPVESEQFISRDNRNWRNLQG